MAKLFVSGYADWWLSVPHIVLSVEAETGKPVDGLTEKNFTVATIGGGAIYGKIDVTDQFEIIGMSRGFYQLALGFPSGVSLWPAQYYDALFAVEAFTDEDRGQALVANKCGCATEGHATGGR